VANLNVGTRSRKKDAEAAKALADDAANQGARIEEIEGGKVAITTAFGLTISTRIE